MSAAHCFCDDKLLPCKKENNVSVIAYNATSHVFCAVGVKDRSKTLAYIETEEIIIYPSYFPHEHEQVWIISLSYQYFDFSSQKTKNP